MNIQKFTQKSIEAVNGCEKVAVDHGNQEIEQEHLLYALMTIEDSLIARLIEKMGIDEKETPTETTQKKTKQTKQTKKSDGGMGDIFGKMGIDLGNLGGLAESVLKTIGLAGKSV